MPAYRAYGPVVPPHRPQPRSEKAPTVLKSIDNIEKEKGNEIQKRKRKSDDFDAILTGYFTMPTIPSISKYCRDGLLGAHYPMQILLYPFLF